MNAIAELMALRVEDAERPGLCPDWCPGGCRREWRVARIATLEASVGLNDAEGRDSGAPARGGVVPVSGTGECRPPSHYFGSGPTCQCGAIPSAAPLNEKEAGT